MNLQKLFKSDQKKIKNIKDIFFDLEKNIGENDFIISNVIISNHKKNEKSEEKFIVKNIQNLRAIVRKLID